LFFESVAPEYKETLILYNDFNEEKKRRSLWSCYVYFKYCFFIKNSDTICGVGIFETGKTRALDETLSQHNVGNFLKAGDVCTQDQITGVAAFCSCIIDIMEDMGIVSEPNGQKPRDVLITRDEWHEMLSRRSLD